MRHYDYYLDAVILSPDKLTLDGARTLATVGPFEDASLRGSWMSAWNQAVHQRKMQGHGLGLRCYRLVMPGNEAVRERALDPIKHSVKKVLDQAAAELQAVT